MADNCHWCKRALLKPTSKGALRRTRDHVFPQSRGGSWTVPCCLACNQLKADMLPEQWRAFCEANPSWWLLFRDKRGRRNAIAKVRLREIISGDPVRDLARRIVREESQ